MGYGFGIAILLAPPRQTCRRAGRADDRRRASVTFLGVGKQHAAAGRAARDARPRDEPVGGGLPRNHAHRRADRRLRVRDAGGRAGLSWAASRASWRRPRARRSSRRSGRAALGRLRVRQAWRHKRAAPRHLLTSPTNGEHDAHCQAARMRSDAELLAAARTDAGAFRELYDRHAGQRPPLPHWPDPRPARRTRPDSRDVRAGMARRGPLPRRGRRLGRPVALRHRTARAARQRAPRRTGARVPASGSACSPRSSEQRPSPAEHGSTASTRRSPTSPSPAGGDPPARRRGPRLRRGGRAAGDHAAGRAGARLARPERLRKHRRSHGEHPMTSSTRAQRTRRPRSSAPPAADLAPRRAAGRRRAPLLAAPRRASPCRDRRAGRRDRRRPADQHRRRGAEPARRDASAGRHRPDLHRRHEGRRVPLRARQGAGVRGDRPRATRTGRARSSRASTRRKHVNGGCRSLANDGREWQCYIGQAAVDQKIISQGFLGEYAPAPGVG